MNYEPVFELLDGYWDCTWDTLPFEQKAAWRRAAFLNNVVSEVGPCEPYPHLHWDNISTAHRQTHAANYDQQHDPANEENSFWFNNASDIADVEREIAKRELMPEQTALNVEAKERLLSDSRKRLTHLKSAQFQPSTVEPHSGAPESGALDPDDTTGMVAWQADIIENKAEILKEYGNAVSARELMLWCKAKGSTDVFKRDQPRTRDSMQWTDTVASDVHTVTIGTIGSQLSEWRRQGVFPKRK